METITAEEFRSAPGVEVWRAGVNGPDVDIRYRGVQVRLFSHSARGLTLKDLMADDSNAPEWWTLADADGHKIDICPSRT